MIIRFVLIFNIVLNSVKRLESDMKIKDEMICKLKEEIDGLNEYADDLKNEFEELKSDKVLYVNIQDELNEKYEKAHKLLYGKIKKK